MLPAQKLYKFIEEPAFAQMPTSLWTNAMSVEPIVDPVINEAHVAIDHPFMRGRRQPTRRVVTAKAIDWSMTLGLKPEEAVWFCKFAMGVILDVGSGRYRLIPPEPGVITSLPSFMLAVDTGKPDHLGAGEQTKLFHGLTIATLQMTASGAGGEDGLFITELTGLGKQPVVSTTATVNILDYADVATNNTVITLTVNGTVNTITEGGDWTAVTSNTVSAAALVVHLNTLTGITATNSAGVVTIVAQAGYTINAITNDESDDTNLTTERDVVDVIQGVPALVNDRPTLFGSAVETGFIFQNAIVDVDSAGFTSAHNFQSFGFRIENTLAPRKFATGDNDPYISAIHLGSQRFFAGYSLDQADAMSRLDDYRNQTARRYDVRLHHPTARNAAGDKYRWTLTYRNLHLTNANPIAGSDGADEVEMRNIEAEGLGKQATETANVATGTDHTLAVNDDWDVGVDGDGEAVKLATISGGGYVAGVRVTLKNASVATAKNLVTTLWTDDGGSPSEPVDGAAGAVVGGVSNTIQSEALNETGVPVYFKFANKPYNNGTAVWWLVIASLNTEANDIEIVGDTGGTNTHSVSVDGGLTWGVPDSDDWDHTIYTDDHAFEIDVQIDSAGQYTTPA